MSEAHECGGGNKITSFLRLAVHAVTMLVQAVNGRDLDTWGTRTNEFSFHLLQCL